jgi:hypothetical protein
MSEEGESLPNEKPIKREFLRGLGYTLLFHCIFSAIMFLFFVVPVPAQDRWGLIPIALIGVTQSVYMIPAIVVAYGKGRDQFGKGLVVGAAVTFLLNATCAGVTILGES